MPIPISRKHPLSLEIAKAVDVPVERIQNWAIVVQYDTGAALLHTLCCDEHAREGLALVAATPPDTPDMSDYTGSN